MHVNRRTQAERSAATRAALITAARPLFAAHGFSAVGTETIVRAAGVTRGALYHQFEDKAELFAAVFEAVEQELTERVEAAVSAAQPDAVLTALRIGTDAWLDACEEPDVQRIVLLEAPAVLGWARWRAIGLRYALGLVTALLDHAIATEEVPPQPVAPLAHLLIGAIDEAALYVAQADDAAVAREEVREVTHRLIRSLAVP
jgi:AcrR family transcriptional regulator